MPVRPAEGLQIDGFTLGPMLHKGGFATIWQVSHPDHDTALVMKVPTILDGDDGPTIVGFEVEQMIMPRLSGPHVPRVIAEGDFAVLPYIVTERVPGESLLPVFSDGPQPWPRVVELARAMLAAVADLHRQGVIHLDLKPANFLRRATGQVVAIDYGLSRHVDLPDLLAEEFTIPMGTFPYIAPEQALGCRDDLRSDLFALGVMVYELLTGRLPFGRPEKLRGVRKRLWRDPEPPRAIVPDCPPWLQEWLLRALRVDPAARYQSAGQMLFDLTHPEQMRLTDQASRLSRDPWRVVFQRWRRMRGLRGFPPPPALGGAQGDPAPVLMVAVDLSPEQERLSARLRAAVARMLTIQPDARVACVNVIRTARMGIDSGLDEDGTNLHVARLVALRAWAAEIDLPSERLTFSVLEGPDPAGVLIDHAGSLQADHVLMGARASSSTRRYLGSVSARVVAEAHCSVTVIRIGQPD